MNAAEVELLARGVNVELGSPFTFLSVNSSPQGWSITLRRTSGDLVRVTVAGGRAVSMRASIHEQLEDGL